MDRKAMHRLSYGLFVLTAREGEKDNGCIINTAIQAASMPNQVSVCVNKANYTHDMVMRTGAFTVSIISQAADFGLFERFGFQSGKDADKFAGFDGCRRGANGILYVTRGTNAYISVKVSKSEDIGSHTMFIGEVTDMEVISDEASATYEYYMENIKPKPQTAAQRAAKTGVRGGKPGKSDGETGQAGNRGAETEEKSGQGKDMAVKESDESGRTGDGSAKKDGVTKEGIAKEGITKEGITVWRCMICGYEYTGEELPDGFICPICKHPASDFEKIEL